MFSSAMFVFVLKYITDCIYTPDIGYLLKNSVFVVTLEIFLFCQVQKCPILYNIIMTFLYTGIRYELHFSIIYCKLSFFLYS